MSFGNLSIYSVFVLMIVLLVTIYSVFQIFKNRKQIKLNYFLIFSKFWANDIITKFRVWIFIIFILIIWIAYIKPLWKDINQKVESNGIDILFLLDVSKSMNAMDIKYQNYQISRLDGAKFIIKNIIKDHANDRAWLVVFAKDAVWVCPLTLDHDVFLTMLNWVDENNVSTQWTDLTMALKHTLSRFVKNDNRSKAIVLLSDWWDENLWFENKIPKELLKNVKLFWVGLWSTKWTPIPQGTDVFWQIIYKTYQWQTVYTKLNEEYLNKFVSYFNWEYFSSKDVNDYKKIISQLDLLNKTVINDNYKTYKQDFTRIFIGISMILFLLIIFLNKKDLLNNKYKEWKK